MQTALDAAWAGADANAWAAQYTPDADFVNILGTVFSGADSIRARHAVIWAGPFRGSRQEGTVRRVRFLGPSAAVVDVDVRVTGFSGLPPGVRATEPGVLRTYFRHVLVRQGEGVWRILLSQNTAVMPPPVT